MTRFAQHMEAPPSPAQAFNAMAGELRALARALAATRDPVALAKALILITLVHILLTLEDMALAWQEGRLATAPAHAPQPHAASRPATVRAPTRHPHARIASAAPRATYTPHATPPYPHRHQARGHPPLIRPPPPQKPPMDPALHHAHFVTIS